MNKHSARTRSKNDIRRVRNHMESKLIPGVVSRVIYSTNRQSFKLLDQGEFPIEFYYPLSKAVEREQRKLGIKPYKLRDSKLQTIIGLLEGPHMRELISPLLDTYTDPYGDIDLLMFRA